MADREKPTSRRDFLRGRSALQAAIDAWSAPLESPLPVGEAGGEQSPAAEKRRQQASHLLEFTKRAMGCQFQLVFNAGQFEAAGESAVELFGAVDSLESQMTIYDSASEISQLNQNPPGTPVKVSQAVFDCLQLALEISEMTGGAFDITSGPLTELWGFERREPSVPEREAVAEAARHVNYREIGLDPNSQSVALGQAGMKVNLGGIGKGFALDWMAEIARELGITDVLIHGGQSSVIAIGNRAVTKGEEGGWRVGLTHPVNPQQRLGELRLRDQCLGTSGSARQALIHEGQRLSHILDPRTGFPAESVASASVISDSAAKSDALATAFCVMELTEIEAICADNPEIAGIIFCRRPNQSRLSLEMFNVDRMPSDLTIF